MDLDEQPNSLNKLIRCFINTVLGKFDSYMNQNIVQLELYEYYYGFVYKSIESPIGHFI